MIGTQNILVFLVFGWFSFGVFVLYFIARWKYMNPFHLRVPGIAMATYLIFLFIPCLLLAPRQVSIEVAKQYIFYTTLAGYFMLIGNALCSIVYPAPRLDPKEYIRAPMVVPSHGEFTPLLMLLAVIVVITTVLRYIESGGNIPLFFLLKNIHAYDEILAARESLKLVRHSLGFRLLHYAIGWSFLLFMPLITIYMLAKHQVTGHRQWKSWFWVAFLFTMFLAMWGGNRSEGARIASIILGGVILVRGRLSMKLIIGGLLIVALPFTLAWMIFPNFTVSKMLSQQLPRLFVAPSQIIYWYFEIFPDVHPHTLGRGTTYLGFFLGRDVISLPLLVANHLSETGFTTTFVNCCFIGDSWAEFGSVGVIGGAILAGCLSQFIQNFIIRRAVRWGKTPQIVWLNAVQIPLWTFVFFSNSILQFFIGHGLIVALILVYLCDYSVKNKSDDELDKELFHK